MRGFDTLRAALLSPQLHLQKLSTMTAALLAAVLVTGCHHQQQVAYLPPPPPLPARHHALPQAPEVAADTQPPATLPEGIHGKPATVEFGLASWYGPNYQKHRAADGSVYDQDGLTAAHRELPLGSIARVTNVATGESVIVRITDRGPFSPGRILDLSMGAAKAIGVYRAGVARVKVEAWDQPNADPAGRWCVQIGAFKQEGDALDLKASLQSRYRNARVIEFTGPTGHWVRINPSTPDHAHANEIARNLDSPDPGALPYVVRLN
jgi:rare lipoprotein A